MTDGARSEDGGLRRQLSLADAVAIFVGIILGSGIFVAPQDVARAAPSAWGGALLWIVGGLVALCGGLCYAECGARLPKAGGFFVFYGTAFGPALAFVAGWAGLAVTYPSSIAAIAHVFARYLGELVPWTAGHDSGVAVALVVVAGSVCAAGVKLGAWAQRILTSAKVLALAGLVIAAVVGAPASAPAAASAPDGGAPGLGLAVLLAAAVSIMWTYDGWSDTPLLAGELRDPARTLGRTVLIGTGVMVLLYAGIQLAVMRLLPADVAAESPRVVVDAVKVGLGDRAGRLVALLIVVSTAGSVNACIFTGSRIAYAMARGGAFPSWFGAVTQATATPTRSVLVLVAATMVYALAAKFRALVGAFTFAVWIFYALTAVALLVLRRRGVGEPVAWRAPLGVLPPLVVILTSAYMTSGLLASNLVPSLVALGVLLLAFPAYFAWRRLTPSPRPA